MGIRYLTIDEVIVLHDYAIERFGGSNGFTISAVSNDELYQFTIEVANSLLDKDDIAEWLKLHTVPFEMPDQGMVGQ
jgi:prophage maintenance system killer protein